MARSVSFFVDSPYRSHISQAVLKLKEEGKVTELKELWWEKNNPKLETVKCQSGGSDEASDTPELGMDNVGGVFLVLIAGLFFSIFIGIMEFLWNVRKVSVEAKVPIIPLMRGVSKLFYLI